MAEKVIDIASILATLCGGPLCNIEEYIYFYPEKKHNGQNGENGIL